MTDFSSQDQWTVTEGADVIGSDGEKVGEVVNANPDYIVVKKGFFFPNDYYVPSSAIASVDEDHVYLNVTKEEAMNQDPSWENEPVRSTSTDVTTSTTAGLGGYATTDADAVTTSSADVVDTDVVETSQTRTTDTDTLRVPLAEEELTATTREVDRGAVGITKNVVAEEQTLEVPVTEERVNVERRVVDRGVTDADAVFEEGTIEVPIRGEEVEVQKEARITEEVEIDKEQVQRTQRVADTVRHEEVDIDDTTGVTGTRRGGDVVQETTVTETTVTDGDENDRRGNPV